MSDSQFESSLFSRLDASIDSFNFRSVGEAASTPVVIILVPDEGGAGNDNVYGLANSDDTVIGNGGDDFLKGLSGDDLLYGGTGNDTMLGDGGNDELRGQAGDDRIKGGRGDDEAFGGRGDDDIYGGAGNDVLKGNGGNDLIDAGTGDDFVFGGAGDDIMAGGEGDDTFAGGTGFDEYIYGTTDAGDDRITDFALDVDVIRLEGVSATEFAVDPISGGTRVTITATGTEIILDGLDYQTVADRIGDIFVLV